MKGVARVLLALSLAACGDPVLGVTPSFDAQLTEAPTPPTLDGQIDPLFADLPAFPIDYLLRGYKPAPEDLSASWRAVYDATALYLVVEVADDTIVADSDLKQLWEDDSIEVFVDGNRSAGDSYDGRDDVHLIFRPHDPVAYPGLITFEFQAGQIGAATQDRMGGYVLELFIPWTAIGTTATTGKMLGLDVQINDDDDGMGRDDKLSWHATSDDAWTRPALFGRVQLSGPLMDAGR